MTRGGGIRRDCMVETFKVTDAGSTGYRGRAGEDPSGPSSGLPETAGETMGEAKTLGCAAARGEEGET